jgi:hypothetical protein
MEIRAIAPCTTPSGGGTCADMMLFGRAGEAGLPPSRDFHLCDYH